MDTPTAIAPLLRGRKKTSHHRLTPRLDDLRAAALRLGIGLQCGPAPEGPPDVGAVVRLVGEIGTALKRHPHGSVGGWMAELLYLVGGATWIAAHRNDPARLLRLVAAVNEHTARQDAEDAPCPLT